MQGGDGHTLLYNDDVPGELYQVPPNIKEHHMSPTAHNHIFYLTLEIRHLRGQLKEVFRVAATISFMGKLWQYRLVYKKIKV